MRIIFTYWLLFASFCSFGQTLIKLWETEPLFNKPESVIYDNKNGTLYVSNINGNYCTVDGNGFISKMDLDGKIKQLKWIDHLDSPQGMGIYNNRLYVADLTKVVVIDIPKGIILHEIKIDGSIFLNDISVGKDGIVYVSDCKANTIYRIKGNEASLWLKDPLLNGPNGLLSLSNKLYVLNMGNGIIYSVNKKNKHIEEWRSGVDNCDGIVRDSKNGFYVSGALQGEIFHLKAKDSGKVVLNLGNEGVITADIWYIKAKKMLLIPTLYRTVMAYLCI